MLKKICLFLSVVVLLAGCSGVVGKISDSIQKEQNTKPSYQFVDVLGKEYKARLLTEVPRTDYKAEQLIEIDGYKYYTDKDGTVTSELGIDVSKYQGDIDWKKVKKAGIDFAIVRLGFRGYGEKGNLVEDENFQENVKSASEAGLGVGVYFFSQALNEEEALEEAQFVLEKIKEYEITYPVVFDTEEVKYAIARTDDLPMSQYTQNCITFCDAIEEAGYQSMIYANMKWMAFTLDLTKLTDYEKWYADYEEHPQCPYAFSMWQYTEKGKVPGIDGNVDLNVYFKE